MANLLESIKDLLSSEKESDTTSKELIQLKKEVAQKVVDDVEKRHPDLFVSASKDLIADYLVSDGFWDSVMDNLVLENTVLKMTNQAQKFQQVKEQIDQAKTREELKQLEDSILNGKTALNSDVSSVQTSSDVSSDVAAPSDVAVPLQEDAPPVSAVSSSAVVAPTPAEKPPHPSRQGKKRSQGKKRETSRSQSSVDASQYHEKIRGFDASKIVSLPFARSKNWVTLCASTARLNAQKFGLVLPSGDAWKASTKNPVAKEYRFSLPSARKHEKPRRGRAPLSLSDFDAMPGVNMADIYTASSSRYWHRSLAFRDISGEWMVLDPYIRVPWTTQTQPKKLKDYMKSVKVIKSHFYAVEA